MNAFTIERKTWARGARGGNSLLEPYDEMKCCLGFCSLAYGLDMSVIRCAPTPAYVGKELYPQEAQWLFHPEDRGHSSTALKLIKVNDAAFMADDEREAVIATLFAAQGITVTFVDELPMARAEEYEETEKPR